VSFNTIDRFGDPVAPPNQDEQIQIQSFPVRPE